jgi:hypothetical protein
MGNQQSRSKDKDSRLWSTWIQAEKEQLQHQFDLITKNDTSGKPELPDYFSKDLYSCIVKQLQSQDISHYIKVANATIRSKDTSVIYSIFQSAVGKDQISLETFVSWVINSSIPIWFESGSSCKWSYSNQSSNLLVKYILTYAQEKEKQKNDTMAWLDDNNKETAEQQAEESWETKVTTSPSKITEAEFIQWIDNTPAFISLFQLVMEFILLGGEPSNKSDNLHKRRIDYISSPQLQQHNDKDLKKLFGKNKFSSLLDPFSYFMLTQYLPLDALSWSDYEKNQRKVTQDLQHSLIFSSRRDGNSWQVFVNKIVSKGATIIIVKTKDGSLFGGYADDAWEYARTDWYGNSSNFLFKLSDKYGAWRGVNSNDHYQYLCWGKKSLPNGFGMGGQFDYAGLWINSDFIHGHSRAGPLSTTYSSPQLSKNDTFIVDEVEGTLIILVLNIARLLIQRLNSLASETTC